MKVLDYINSHENWEKELAGAPWHLNIKKDGDYVILKYNQLESDFSEVICQECRGLIIYFKEDKWEVVCHPFNKFFNYGEVNAAKIDWDTAYVTEKIDGSLIKIWYHEGWHISTNGTIDAFKAPVGKNEVTFGDLVVEVLDIPVSRFDEAFPRRDYTYMFELVHPMVPHPIMYDGIKAMYFIGLRSARTDKEMSSNVLTEYLHPKVFNFSSFDSCVEEVKQWDANHEGVVVCDANFNRVKIKADQYLTMHYLHNNGHFKEKDIVEAIMNNTIDDIEAMFSYRQEEINNIKNAYNKVQDTLEKDFIQFYQIASAFTRKEQALYIFNHYNYCKDWMFFKLDNLDKTPIDFFNKIGAEKTWMRFVSKVSN